MYMDTPYIQTDVHRDSSSINGRTDYNLISKKLWNYKLKGQYKNGCK